MILLIEPDEEIRPLLRFDLQNYGYLVTTALCEADAGKQGWDDRNCPSLILLNQVGLSIEEFVGLGQAIRWNTNLPEQTPIVVIAEQYASEMEGKNVQVGTREYVVHLKNGQQLINLLHYLCPIQVNFAHQVSKIT
ncbi:hypothetical protein IFO70_17780 [Phormidium tenue FACHB-886]|nr:hypothetical protein [Phormidium tenue FACHB-886]